MRFLGWPAVALVLVVAVLWSARPLNGQESSHADTAHADSAEHADGGAEDQGASGQESSGGHDQQAGSHADAHHDEHDLAHNNAGDQIEDPSEFKSDLAIWTFVVFLCLLGLLTWKAWDPIISGLDKREQAIADQIEAAKHSADQAALQLQKYEAQLAAAGEQARGILAEARQDAEAAKDRIIAEAQQAAERARQRAVSDIAAAKNVALDEITERSVDLAQVMASRLLQRELHASDRAALVKEALDQLPSQN